MKLDLNNFDHKLIVAAMVNLVDKGASPREVLELLDDIKKNTWHALVEISQERKEK